MTLRESKLDMKDLEVLKNLPNLAEKLNQNMKTVDNIINAQRELNSSISSLNSSNNGFRALGQSKGKNRKINLEEAIDIKNIVRKSIQGLNSIFDNDKKSDLKISTKNQLSSSSNSSLGVLKDNNLLNSYGNTNMSIEDATNSNFNNISYVGKNIGKGKNINLGINIGFEPIEEELNPGNIEFTTNNFGNFLKTLKKKNIFFKKSLKS